MSDFITTRLAEMVHDADVMLDAGQIRPLVAEILPLAQAGQAYEHKQGGLLVK